MKLQPLLELGVPPVGAKECECTFSLQSRHHGPFAKGRKKGIVQTILNPGGVFLSMKGEDNVCRGHTFPWREGTWLVHSFLFFLSSTNRYCVLELSTVPGPYLIWLWARQTQSSTLLLLIAQQGWQQRQEAVSIQCERCSERRLPWKWLLRLTGIHARYRRGWGDLCGSQPEYSKALNNPGMYYVSLGSCLPGSVTNNWVNTYWLISTFCTYLLYLPGIWRKF